jgi:hypothetical protein
MKRYIQFTPLVVLIGAVVYSLYIVNTTNIILGTKQYIGIAFVVCGIVLAFIQKDLATYLIGIALLLGTVNAIAFTPKIESYSFGFSFNDGNGIDFKVQPFSFWVLLVYLATNYKSLLALVRRTSKSGNVSN